MTTGNDTMILIRRRAEVWETDLQGWFNLTTPYGWVHVSQAGSAIVARGGNTGLVGGRARTRDHHKWTLDALTLNLYFIIRVPWDAPEMLPF